MKRNKHSCVIMIKDTCKYSFIVQTTPKKQKIIHDKHLKSLGERNRLLEIFNLISSTYFPLSHSVGAHRFHNLSSYSFWSCFSQIAVAAKWHHLPSRIAANILPSVFWNSKNMSKAPSSATFLRREDAEHLSYFICYNKLSIDQCRRLQLHYSFNHIIYICFLFFHLKR